MFDITIYCPDTHVLYNGAMPTKKGIGGGIMARICLAQAFARIGCTVTIIGHVGRLDRYAGVNYIPLENADQKTETDILILTSSGGHLSLEPAQNLHIQSKWCSVWVHGTHVIKGLDQFEWGNIITCSNFINKCVQREWNLTNPRVSTIYNGAVIKKSFWDKFIRRNSFRLIYTSHPDKGLFAALAILRKLREIDNRFHLFVYGGNALWGAKDDRPVSEPGVTFFGTRGNSEVLQALKTALVSLNLQSRPEAFGMVLTESMMHGAIPIASPVGAYPELISHGQNGVLIDGDFESGESHVLAAEWILRFNQNSDVLKYIQKNAMNIPWDWNTMAKVWAGFFDWKINRKGVLLSKSQVCSHCSGGVLALADGYHCVECGWYFQNLNSSAYNSKEIGSTSLKGT